MTAEVERTDWLSYPTENFIERNYRAEPPTGAIRSTCQTALRCFCLRIEVLSGQGKGMLKEAFQVFIQELNASELSRRCRNSYRQCQKPKELSLLRDKYGSYLGDKLPVLALGIKAAGLVYGLDYGTVEAN